MCFFVPLDPARPKWHQKNSVFLKSSLTLLSYSRCEIQCLTESLFILFDSAQSTEIFDFERKPTVVARVAERKYPLAVLERRLSSEIKFKITWMIESFFGPEGDHSKTYL